MQITSIKVMKRKNLGNYEHEEITVEAMLAEGEDHSAAIINLKSLVNCALNGFEAPVSAPTESKPALTKETEASIGGKPIEEVRKAKATTKTKAEKATKEEPVKESAVEGDVPPVLPQEEASGANAGGTSQVVGRVDTANVTSVQQDSTKASAPVSDKGIVKYDASIKEHRSRFATYLGANYPKWKTCKPEAQIKEFSLGLNGKPFEDAKGNMLEVFKAEIESFFATAK